jgi:hypothetical protein
MTSSTMRVGPTSNHLSGLKELQRLPCANCKAEFSSLQVVNINDKQLCIWCAGHPRKMPSRSFTRPSQLAASPGRIVYKVP